MQTFKPGDSFYYYTVQRVLGVGYHGAVYEIRHDQTGDLSALKTMHVADWVDPAKTARALVGAKANYRIDHHNVVKVLDLNCESNGLVWMRTELLRGATLQELLAKQGRVSLPFALAAATEAAFGLHAVHEAQSIHRDVKPSNLFYTEGRGVKVIDLSLAKVFPEGLETTVGKLGLGTPAYSAPEQLEGQVRPDVRFDVYGLGITLWEMLAGRHPFQETIADTQALLKQQLTVMPPLLSEVALMPARVDAVVRRAIAKNPLERYGSMMEMARALMDLGAWVDAEARARRIVVVVPPGEPQRPGNPNAWRQYSAPEPTPQHEAPPMVPSARVIVADIARPRAQLASTEPLDPVSPRPTSTADSPVDGDLAVTAPMADRRPPGGPSEAVKTARGTTILPAPSLGPARLSRRSGEASRAEQTPPRAETTAGRRPSPWRPIPSASALASAPPRSTPLGVATTRPGSVSPGERRVSWPAMIVALVATALATVVCVLWLGGRRAATSASESASPHAGSEPVGGASLEPTPTKPSPALDRGAASGFPLASASSQPSANARPPARAPGR